MMCNASDISEAFVDLDMVPSPPAASDLRAVVPPPLDAELSKLEEVSSRHRVLLMRTGAVIAVTTLISVGGALLFHMLLAGLIVIGVWFPGIVPGARGGGLLPGAPDAGGSPGGFTLLGSGPDDNAPPAALAPDIVGTPAPQLAGMLPLLPEVRSTQIAAAITAPVLPPLTPQDFGQVPVRPPALDVPAPVLPSAIVAAPGSAASVTDIPAGPSGLPARGTDAGNGGGEEDRIFGLVKGDGSPGSGGGGIGTGSGSGRGRGLNRGMALGDRAAQPLNQSSSDATLTLPTKYQLHLPEKDVVLAIAIAADGTITSVRVEGSCGVAEVDEIVRAYVAATYRFSPEFRAGKAVDSVQHLHYVFHPL